MPHGVTEEISTWKGAPSSRIGRLSLATMPVLPKLACSSMHRRQNPSRLHQAHPKCHGNPRAPEHLEQPGEKTTEVLGSHFPNRTSCKAAVTETAWAWPRADVELR